MSITQRKSHFWSWSDSLSSLQAIHNRKYDVAILTKVHELHSNLLQDEKEILFVWVPGHVGIRGNPAADTAAKDALDGDISDELISFSDLKSQMSEYIMELWQHEWDKWPDNTLPQLRPKLNDYHPSCRTNRREETVSARLHIGHSYLTPSFLLKERNVQCVFPVTNHLLWNMLFTAKNGLRRGEK